MKPSSGDQPEPLEKKEEEPELSAGHELSPSTELSARPKLLDIAPSALVEMLGGPGRARAVYALLREGLDPFTDQRAPAGARRRLSSAVSATRAQTVSLARSRDRTTKTLLRFDDGLAVETVLIPEQRRTTLCVSSQVGCARGCTFCLTATMKLIRNLTAAEIVAQVVHATKLAKDDELPTLRNIVFMGMGEPLDNFDAVARATEIITGSGLGLGFGPSHVTVSSVGPSPRAISQAKQLPAQIAWSLHSANDETRARIVPTQRHTITELRDAFLDVAQTKRSPLFVEITLLEGINDTDQAAQEIVDLFKQSGTEIRFNLLPMNPIPGSTHTPSTRAKTFETILRSAGYFTMIRKPRGTEERAACGQLAVLDQHAR